MSNRHVQVQFLAAAADRTFDLRDLALPATGPAAEFALAQILGVLRKFAVSAANFAFAEFSLPADFSFAIAKAALRLAERLVMAKPIGDNDSNLARTAAGWTVRL